MRSLKRTLRSDRPSNCSPSFQLCPAHTSQALLGADIPISIVHGWHDDVVPAENSIRFAAKCHATLHLVDGDHRLSENIDEIIQYLASFIRVLADDGATG